MKSVFYRHSWIIQAKLRQGYRKILRNYQKRAQRQRETNSGKWYLDYCSGDST